MNPTSNFSLAAVTPAWQRFAAGTVRAFHAYATWLVRLSWKRFFLLALALLLAAAILQGVPPFSWTYTEVIEEPAPSYPTRASKAPKAPAAPKVPGVTIHRDGSSAKNDGEGLDISIDENGVRIRKREKAAEAAASAASAASAAAADAASAAGASGAASGAALEIQAGEKGVRILLPPGADSQAVRDAIEKARESVVEAIEEQTRATEEATAAAAEAAAAAEEAAAEAAQAESGPRIRTETVRYGEFLPNLAFLWILFSALVKVTYKGRIQAEVKAAQATETAEAESLRRQVVEARMAAMQAQVEPHFLFNTLASIDHLIETDPARASQMQKNLIALLRASMPSMRETNDAATRDLGRELAVVRPYVEILKVRMEERLVAEIDVPEGLLSAQFPQMMIQTLVENAIRHGLEPKAEGGHLKVKAEIVHGKLAVTVADTGVGFGNANTSGTGVGLANIRERLQMLHGDKATLTVAANSPSGTVVTITVPYRTVEPAPGSRYGAAAAA